MFPTAEIYQNDYMATFSWMITKAQDMDANVVFATIPWFTCVLIS